MNLYELYNCLFTLNFFDLFLNDLNDILKQRGIATDDVYVGEIEDEYHFIGRLQIYLKTNNLHEKWRPSYFYLYSDGWHIADSLAKYHLEDPVNNWTEYVRNKAYAAHRIRDFWKGAKEELVAAAWRPDRVAKWVEAGVAIESL